jgi:transcriptional regulator with XRE-family HTH domain
MTTSPFTLALRRLLDKQGMSVIELAERAGMGRTTVYRFLQGWHPDPRYGTIKKLAKGLGVEPWDFFGWDEAEEVPLDEDLFELLQLTRGLPEDARYRLLSAARAERDTQVE